LNHRSDRADGLSTSLMLVLSFGTGMLDAATYLGLHQVFTANMTGNVVFVGLGLANADDVPLLRATLALVGFVVGATTAGLLQRGRKAWPNSDGVAATVLLVAAAVVGASAVVLHTGDLGEIGLDLLTGALGWAMGAQAVAARRVAVGDVSTVVVTSTLAGLFAEAVWSGNTAGHAATLRRAGAVVSMMGGAVAGAFLLTATSIALAVAVPAALLLVVGLVTLTRVLLRRRQPVEHDGVVGAEDGHAVRS
jgi:uncharacterized membrane protein YoaK (UPF0700 family)